MEFLGGFCASALANAGRGGCDGADKVPCARSAMPREEQAGNAEAHGSLLDHLRPTVVDIGEIQFPPAVPARSSQPRGTSAPNQRGAGSRLKGNQYPYYAGGGFSDPPSNQPLIPGAASQHLYDKRWPNGIGGGSASSSGCARSRPNSRGTAGDLLQARQVLQKCDSPSEGHVPILANSAADTASLDVAASAGAAPAAVVGGGSRRSQRQSVAQALTAKGCLLAAQDSQSPPSSRTIQRPASITA